MLVFMQERVKHGSASSILLCIRAGTLISELLLGKLWVLFTDVFLALCT